MNPNFFIHYEGQGENSSEIDLVCFGESLQGFDKLIKEIINISGLGIEVEVRAKPIREGSNIAPLVVESITSLGITNLVTFLDFLRFIGESQIYESAVSFFNEVTFSLESLQRFLVEACRGETRVQEFANNFARERPAEAILLEIFLIRFIEEMIARASSWKNLNFPPEGVPITIFKKGKKIINNGRFLKPLKPIIEEEASQIGFSANGVITEESSIISNENFENYLADTEVTLSDFTNGSRHTVIGEVKNFQSSRGDFMKVNIRHSTGEFLLVVIPRDGHSTDEYIRYYKKNVFMEVEIVRESMFKKPKLKVIEIGLHQTSFIEV